MKRLLILVFACSLLLPGVAFSQGYLSATLGQSDIEASGFDEVDSLFDEADSWSVTGGYKLTEFFAVEVSYVDSGKFKVEGVPSLWVKGDVYDFGIVGIIPLPNNFSLFVRAGYMQWEAKSSLGDRDDGHDYNFGAGAEYSFNERFSLIAEYKRFQFDDDNGPDDVSVETISIGAKVYF